VIKTTSSSMKFSVDLLFTFTFRINCPFERPE
jgi:hypothetical protein